MQQQSELICEHCNIKEHTKATCYEIIGYPLDIKNRKKEGHGSFHQKKYNANWSISAQGGIMGNPNSTINNCMIQQTILMLSGLIVGQDHNTRLLILPHMININRCWIYSIRMMNWVLLNIKKRIANRKNFEVWPSDDSNHSWYCKLVFETIRCFSYSLYFDFNNS